MWVELRTEGGRWGQIPVKLSVLTHSVLDQLLTHKHSHTHTCRKKISFWLCCHTQRLEEAELLTTLSHEVIINVTLHLIKRLWVFTWMTLHDHKRGWYSFCHHPIKKQHIYIYSLVRTFIISMGYGACLNPFLLRLHTASTHFTLPTPQGWLSFSGLKITT